MGMQVLPAGPTRRTVGQRLSAGVGQGLQYGNQLMQQHQESEAMEALGIPAGTPPELAKIKLAESLRGQRPLSPLQETQQKLAEAKLGAIQSNQKLFADIFGGGHPQGEGIQLNQQEMPNQEPNQQKMDLSKVPREKLEQAAAFAGQPGDVGTLGTIAKNELDRQKETEKARTDKEKQYFKFNEPKVAELAETQRKLEMEGARYGRLEELFSDPSKFPTAFTASLFTKDGQINDKAYALLSPEAQEALKLIIDSTSNIKDTYGARVTNFDLSTYLKKLPSLLNSPEGKMRVLRDLQIMNQLNQMHAKGIQEIFQEAGGTDKIPYSTAEERYKKKYRKQENDLLDNFIHAEKGKFKDKPNPQKYLGKKIKDTETGEILISDGFEWKQDRG